MCYAHSGASEIVSHRKGPVSLERAPAHRWHSDGQRARAESSAGECVSSFNVATNRIGGRWNRQLPAGIASSYAEITSQKQAQEAFEVEFTPQRSCHAEW